MQPSKSLLLSRPPTEEILGTRPRTRSSLDTFLIPGRIRVPSRDPNPADLQITQGLLNHSMKQPPSRQPRLRGPKALSGHFSEVAQTHDGSPAPRATSRAASRTGSIRKQHHRPPTHLRVRPAITLQPPPRYGSREVIIVPHRRPRNDPSITFQEDHQKTYDGANDVLEEAHLPSRMTSMSWSTLSQRIFTDSSTSTRYSEASHFLEEYNQLAEKHGLHRMAEAPSDDNSTKITTKTHQHNWIARKLFRRSSSTYTLKAKTTYKPLTRKKSLGGITLLSEGGAPKNTLKDKSLEEVGRLGGLGILTLPPEFAVDKLVLPTCLSATATYLCQHGCNSPGIFRVSGQVTTINALYDYYNHQFTQAGSPSRVEETVGCGQLPAHIEYTVPDVASVFKKILIGLPGGLLGSLELFEAFRDILYHLNFNPDMPDPERTALRARLIALAIVSVTSTYRVYLIQAILGLVAYFASEAERIQADISVMDGQERPSQAKSELMGYQSFGVVLGPLLLGDLTNNIDISSRESQEDVTGPPTDTTKKIKKQKRNTALNKLEKDANLTAQVDRANLTADIMHLLLLNWKDVVKQLQHIHGKSSSQSRSISRPKNDLSNAGSRLSLRASNEDMLFIDVLRGRTLPDDLKGIPVQMKGKVRISSRSPMSRGALNLSKDEYRRPIVAELPIGNEERIEGHSSTNHGDRAVEDVRRPDESSGPFQSTVDVSHSEDEEHSPSDLELARMAMGTMLPPPKNSPSTMRPGGSPRHATPTSTPRQLKHQRSSSDAPATTVKVVHSPIYNTLPAARLQWSLDKPLPPSPPKFKEDTADSLRIAPHETHLPEWAEDPSSPTRSTSPNAHLPPSLASDTDSFLPRQSSLVREARLPMRAIKTYESLAEYKAPSDACTAPPLSAPHSRKTSDAQSRDEELPPAGEKRNSVRMLAQQFAEASRAKFKSDEAGKDNALPKVYAYIQPLSPKHGHSQADPFTTRPDKSTSPERETLIPKPVRNIGRSRKAESRSPSPPKAVSPTRSGDKRPSVYNIVPDQDAEIVKKNTTSLSLPQTVTNAEDVDSEGSTSRFSRIFDGLMRTIPERGNQATAYDVESASTHPGSSYPTGAQNIPSPIQEEQQRSASSVPERVMDIVRSGPARQPKSPNLLYGFTNKNPTRTNSYLDASNALKPLERHGSMNATLYSEIVRLQRLLEQKGEEVQSAKREVDAVRDAYKEGDVTDQNGHGRWSQGKLDEEINEARKEVSIWKRRAQAAEERLKGMGGLAGVVAEVIDQKTEGSDGNSAVAKRRDSGNGMEILEKTGAARGMNVEVKVWRKEEERREESEHTGRVVIQESDDDETF